MITNLQISINVDPSSTSCTGCQYSLDPCKLFGCRFFEDDNIPQRTESCLSAQKQAEDSKSELVDARLKAIAEHRKCTVTELHQQFLQEAD